MGPAFLTRIIHYDWMMGEPSWRCGRVNRSMLQNTVCFQSQAGFGLASEIVEAYRGLGISASNMGALNG